LIGAACAGRRASTRDSRKSGRCGGAARIAPGGRRPTFDARAQITWFQIGREVVMRKAACGVMTVLVAVVAVEAAAAWPFTQIWERRKAELYARLSRDVTVRVNARVHEAKQDLQDSLDTQVADEAEKLRLQFQTGSEQLDARFEAEAKALDEAFAVEAKALRERVDAQFQEMKKAIDAEVAKAATTVAGQSAAEAKKTADRVEAVGKEVAAKTTQELERIEKRSAAEFEKLAAAADKRLETELTELRAQIDERMTALAREMKERHESDEAK